MNLKKRHIQPSGKKQNQTQISTELKAPCTVPRSCHSSFSSSSLARSVVADDSFRDQICGRGYASVDKLPLPISGTSSQQSLVPTPINPTKTIPPETHKPQALLGKNGHVRNSDQSDHWEHRASTCEESHLHCICNNVNLSQAYGKCTRKILILPLLTVTTAQNRSRFDIL